MSKTAKKICRQPIYALIITLTFFMPALLFNFFFDGQIQWFNGKYFCIFFLFGMIISSCGNILLQSAFFLIISLLELTQFGSLAYSKDYITPFTINYMFTEFLDVSEVALTSLKHLYKVPLIVIVPYAACLFLLYRSRHQRLTNKVFSALLVLVLLFPAIRINLHSDSKDILKFFPRKSKPTLMNTLNSYSVWLTAILPARNSSSAGNFKPYEVSYSEVKGPVNIVIIMGESFSSNRMSLFGYGRKTTPKLDMLSNDQRFIAKQGISAATATRSSLPMFYTVQYNPVNRKVIENQTTNLFSLARKQGFKTFYISSQNLSCLNGIMTRDIDYLATYESHKETFDKYKDEALIKIFESQEPGEQKNFIVLHQRSAHAPYKENYSKRPGLKKFQDENLPYREITSNSYDNAVIYNDFLITEIIRTFTENSKVPTYIYATSDHGEALGDNGYYGHDKLKEDVSSIPFIFYSWGGEVDYTDRIRALVRPTHYELSLLIADRLGCRIENPNREKGVFFVNGISSFGKSGYMKFRKGSKGEMLDQEIHYEK